MSASEPHRESATERQLAIVALALVFAALALKVALMVLTEQGRLTAAFDSNYYLNIGSNYLLRGGTTPYMWRIPPDSIILSGSGSGYGIYLLLWWFRAFGLSLASGHRLMFLIGLLTLPPCYLLARQFWGSVSAGAAAVAFTALCGMFVDQFFVRMDAPAVLAYAGLLLLHLYAKRSGRGRLHVVVGFLAVVAMEFHVLASIWAVALGLQHTLDFVRSALRGQATIRGSALLFYLAGAVPAAATYAALHILPDPSSYFFIAREASFGGHFGLLQEAARLLCFVPREPIEAAILALGLALAVARRTPQDRALIELSGCFAVAMLLVNPPVSVPYTAHGLPLYGLVVGGLWAEATLPAGRLDATRAAMGLSIGLVMLVNVGSVARTAMKNEAKIPPPVDYVRRYVPRDAVVWGSPRDYHLLLDYPNYLSFTPSWDSLVGAKLRREDYATFLERERPVVLIGGLEASQQVEREYLRRHGFIEVRPNVLVDPELKARIAAAHPKVELSLTATPEVFVAGGCGTLRWTAVGGDPTLDGEPVSPSGQREICPVRTTRYALAVAHATGVDAQTISVEMRP